MNINIRKFEAKDIPDKVKWINDPANNKYLHYDLPLTQEKTLAWLQRNQNRTDRYDAVIEADGIPIGLIGLLGIDFVNKKAEYYITIGVPEFKGTRASVRASNILLEYAFRSLKLNRVYLFTEEGNIAAQKLFEKIGFSREGLAKYDLYYGGKYVSRYLYGLDKDTYFGRRETILYRLGEEFGNNIYIKREDLYPFSFGGNKARKAMLFWQDMRGKGADYVVTYGSPSSNHCRVIANIAAADKIPCRIISPKESGHDTYNRKMMEKFGAQIVCCEVEKVHDTIEETLLQLRGRGFSPYFIQGGGHGRIGTQAYVNCYDEIVRYEKRNYIHFDYIFHASGTGTTQAGLVCGQMLSGDRRKVVGISIARKCPYGRDVIRESVRQYLGEGFSQEETDKNVIFDDSYIAGGYGCGNAQIRETISDVMCKYGIPLDETYTGKAFWGMKRFLLENEIKNKNILFIHTGGTPLFFDDLRLCK